MSISSWMCFLPVKMLCPWVCQHLSFPYHIPDTYKRSFLSSLVMVIPVWSSSYNVLWALHLQAKAQDGLFLLQTWVFKRFLPAGKWVLSTRSFCPSGEKMHQGFFFTCWYFVLMSRTQKCELQTLAQRDVARWREAPVSARGCHIQCKGKEECHS